MANPLTYKGLCYKTFKYEGQLNKEKVMYNNMFSKLVNKCKNLSYGSVRNKSPETRLRLIMDNVEKINAINVAVPGTAKARIARSEELRVAAVAKCWEYYNMVLARVDSMKDEAWNNAMWNSAKGEMEYDNVYFYGTSNELDEYVGSELSGENSVTKVVRYE
jgi:hypothetical protein